MPSDRSKMPSRKAIALFWLKTIYAFDKHTEATAEGEACFACSRPFWLDRAHIVPACKGGSDSVENLHVLCKICHLYSENYSGSDYWRWFREAPLWMVLDMPHLSWETTALLEGVRSPTVERRKEQLIQRTGSAFVQQSIETYRRLGNGVPSTF